MSTSGQENEVEEIENVDPEQINSCDLIRSRLKVHSATNSSTKAGSENLSAKDELLIKQSYFPIAEVKAVVEAFHQKDPAETIEKLKFIFEKLLESSQTEKLLLEKYDKVQREYIELKNDFRMKSTSLRKLHMKLAKRRAKLEKKRKNLEKQEIQYQIDDKVKRIKSMRMLVLQSIATCDIDFDEHPKFIEILRRMRADLPK